MGASPHPSHLDFRAALSTGERLMAEQSAKHGFSVERPVTLFRMNGAYTYLVKSGRDIRDKLGQTYVSFNSDTGALISLGCRRASIAATPSPMASRPAHGRCIRPALPHLRLRARARYHHAVGDGRLHLVEEAKGAHPRQFPLGFGDRAACSTNVKIQQRRRTKRMRRRAFALAKGARNKSLLSRQRDADRQTSTELAARGARATTARRTSERNSVA